MRVSWLFPSLFVPLFFPLFCSSGWLTWKCFQFSLIENTVSYWFIIYRLYYIVIQSIPITSAASGRATQGLEQSPTWGSELTHRHPQIQKGLLSSAENRVIKYHALIARTSHQFAFDPPSLRDCLSCLSPTQILWQRILRLSHLSLSLVFRYPEEMSHDRDPVNMVPGYSTPRHGSNEFL